MKNSQGCYKALVETSSIVLALLDQLREPFRIDPSKWWMGSFVLLILLKGKLHHKARHLP